MPRPVPFLLTLALLGAAAIALSACGEEDAQLLPGGTAREITANLDTVQQLADEGDCLGAESAALQVSEQVEALDEVDPKLKQALREGATRLNEVVAGCEEELEAVPDETTTEPEPSSDEKEAEREDKEREKEVEEEEKEREKEERESEQEAEQEDEAPLPPQAEGEGKGLDDGDGTGQGNSGEGGAPSGGVSPGSPAEGE
ncbi:MAG TPA: hypothetical protein VF729_10100 [Solirubrobacterales bacterium]